MNDEIKKWLFDILEAVKSINEYIGEIRKFEAKFQTNNTFHSGWALCGPPGSPSACVQVVDSTDKTTFNCTSLVGVINWVPCTELFIEIHFSSVIHSYRQRKNISDVGAKSNAQHQIYKTHEQAKRNKKLLVRCEFSSPLLTCFRNLILREAL